jgi:hypothetical protein
VIVKELFGLLALGFVLVGITYAIAQGDSSVKIIGAGGDAYVNALKAIRPS